MAYATRRVGSTCPPQSKPLHIRHVWYLRNPRCRAVHNAGLGQQCLDPNHCFGDLWQKTHRPIQAWGKLASLSTKQHVCHSTSSIRVGAEEDVQHSDDLQPPDFSRLKHKHCGLSLLPSSPQGSTLPSCASARGST